MSMDKKVRRLTALPGPTSFEELQQALSYKPPVPIQGNVGCSVAFGGSDQRIRIPGIGINPELIRQYSCIYKEGELVEIIPIHKIGIVKKSTVTTVIVDVNGVNCEVLRSDVRKINE